MKIKYILGIMLLLAFLVGCTDPFIGDECVDDGVCTLREKYLGNCFDCFPDFEVTEDSFYAHLDGNNLHANVCVRNKVNEYKGEVKVRWTLQDSSGYQHFEEEEYVYFDSDDAWGYFSLNVDPGKINFNTFLEIGQNEQWSCFRRNFEVDPSHEYRISFHINPYEEVDEQDYSNNYASILVEGELDLSEYLILETIGRFRLLNYNVDTFDDFFTNTYYKFKVYGAYYREKNNYVDVTVATNFESGDAHSLLFDTIDFFELEQNYQFNLTEFNNEVVFVGENNHMVMWYHGNRLIMVSSENVLENDVFLEYINRFPSTIYTELPVCEEPIECEEGEISVYLYTDENGCDIYECFQERIREINNFRIEEGKFKFDIHFIYRDMYIDDKIVSDFSKGPVGGGASHTWYETDCKEGNLLELKFINPNLGLITRSFKDISEYECIEEHLSLSIDLEKNFAFEIEGKYRTIKFVNTTEEFGVFQIGSDDEEEIEFITLSVGEMKNVLGISILMDDLFCLNVGEDCDYISEDCPCGATAELIITTYDEYWLTSDIAILNANANINDEVVLTIKNNLNIPIEIQMIRLSPNLDSNFLRYNSTNFGLGVNQEKTITGNNINGICNQINDVWQSRIRVEYTNLVTGSSYIFNGDGNHLKGICKADN